jgi:hypothetical protein
MANVLDKVIPQLLAQGLLALRENAVLPWLVNTSYSDMAAQKGDSINIPIPSAIEVQDVVPSNTPPPTADVQPPSVTLNMDQWVEAPLYLTDKEYLEVMAGTIPMQASEAIKSLANYVDRTILSNYKRVFGVWGTPGTTPFASDTSDATGVRKVLSDQLCPLQDRRMIIDTDAESNALNLRAFQDASFSGDARGIINGQINHKLGFDWFMDQNVLTHAAGDAAAYAVSGDVAAGATVVPVTGGTGDFAVGDVVSFAGHEQTYAVEDWSGGNLTIYPALVADVGDTAAVSLVADHVVNLGIHRDCFAWVSRPLVDNTQGLGNLIIAAGDEVSGINLRLEVSREHKRTRFSYDILFGTTCARPELGCRLLG